MRATTLSLVLLLASGGCRGFYDNGTTIPADTNAVTGSVTVPTPQPTTPEPIDTDVPEDTDSPSETGDTGSETVATATGDTGISIPTGDTGEIVIVDTDIPEDTDVVSDTGLPVDTDVVLDTGTVDSGPPDCLATESRLKFVYISEPNAAGVTVSTEMNNLGMWQISEGNPVGWHMTSELDTSNVTTVTVWNDTCTLDTALWQASAAFVGGWSCTGGVAPYTTRGSWQVYEDDVLATTTYVPNGLGGCELQVN